MHDGGAALAPWVARAQSCTPDEAVQVIVGATEAPGTSVFGELLVVPSIQAHAAHAAAYRTLVLFACGTWGEYASDPSAYMPLTPAQQTKLRQLTLLSLAHRHRIMPYDTAQDALGLPTSTDAHATRKFEDVVIESIYQNFLAGRLDGHKREVHVDQVTARDVPRHDAVPSGAEGLARLGAALEAWQGRAYEAARLLDTHIAQLHAARTAQVQTQSAHHDALVRALTEARNASTSYAREEEESMDLVS